MSLPKYPVYKDSGVTWLGEVPEHWQTRKLRWLFEIKKRISGKLGYHVLSITQQGIKIKDIESNDGQLSMDYSKYQIVEVGDFAMNHMDLLTGYVDISKIAGVTSPDYRVFTTRNSNDCYEKYYLYLFQMGYRNKIFYPFGHGSSQLGRWRLPTEQFNDFCFPLPPIGEQTAIANFLDQETRKIDVLVAEQENLIALLKEKRQAVISHAVTKGLNPNAPMKDSGIEWLCEVPAHWSICGLKRFCDVRDGTHDTPVFINPDVNTVPLVTSKDLLNGDVVLEHANHISWLDYLEISKRSGVVIGDLLMPMIGSIGGAVIVEIEQLFAIKNIALFKNSYHHHNHWLKYVLNSDLANYQFDLSRSGGVQGFIGLGTLRNLTFAFPSIDEQELIATYLDKEISKFDVLITEAEYAITLLKKRRSVVISAAVTGKIDVRSITLSKQIQQSAMMEPA